MSAPYREASARDLVSGHCPACGATVVLDPREPTGLCICGARYATEAARRPREQLEPRVDRSFDRLFFYVVPAVAIVFMIAFLVLWARVTWRRW